jgi:hypothetical protein
VLLPLLQSSLRFLVWSLEKLSRGEEQRQKERPLRVTLSSILFENFAADKVRGSYAPVLVPVPVPVLFLFLCT